MLIALTLLVTAIIPLASLMATSLKTTVVTSTRMYARQLASNDIDKIKGLHFESVGLSTATANFALATDGQDVKPENGYGAGQLPQETVQMYSGNAYTVTRDIHKKVSTTNSNAATKEVVITVSWSTPEPAGSVQLSTLIGMTDMPPSS